MLNLAPTIYELTNTAHPQEWNGKPSQPLLGASLVPVLEGTTTSIHEDEYVFGFEQSSMAMLRKGKWKITNTEKSFTIGNFQLYNLSADLGEQKDLSKSIPEKCQEIRDEWRNWAQKVAIIFPIPILIDSK
jgi:arylsulfatase A-like enzyme